MNTALTQDYMSLDQLKMNTFRTPNHVIHGIYGMADNKLQ